MKATDLLKKQHKEVRDMFKRLKTEDNGNARSELFQEIATNLVAHDSIERKIFYPACEQQMGMSADLGEALVEHGVVEFSLYQADQAQQDDDFEFKCKVLQDVLEHHMGEEETNLLPEVEASLGKELLEELGVEMLDAFQAGKKEDFRIPLHGNLKQVLTGTLNPSTPRSSAKKAANRTARTRKSE
jgi:hypothetical protein